MSLAVTCLLSLTWWSPAEVRIPGSIFSLSCAPQLRSRTMVLTETNATTGKNYLLSSRQSVTTDTGANPPQNCPRNQCYVRQAAFNSMKTKLLLLGSSRRFFRGDSEENYRTLDALMYWAWERWIENRDFWVGNAEASTSRSYSRRRFNCKREDSIM